ncbi:MAG: hypothetical protein AAF322_21385 [Pseudomonadota bacterium]
MFVVAPSTVLNPGALDMRKAPKRMLGRIAVLPRRGASAGFVARLIFEFQFLRYLLPLTPFVVAMLIWPALALPIAQAPLPMFVAIAFVEMKVLSVSKAARPKLIDEDEEARGLDALRFNARRILTRIAARRNLTEGEIMLVVEQSELARIAPLTLVSLQSSHPKAAVLDLDEEERAMIREDLFDDPADLRRLHRISLKRDEHVHAVPLDVASISAHARIAALTAAAPVAEPA